MKNKRIVEEFEAHGLKCVIAFGGPGLRNYNGYVRAPEGVEFDEHSLDVHGGVTWDDWHLPWDDWDGRGDHRWLGFDTAHAGDATPGLPGFEGGVFRDIDYVRAECVRLAEQLSGLAPGTQFNATEASVMRSIVSVAEEFGIIPTPFASHVASAYAKLEGVREGTVDFDPEEASALLATTYAYTQRSNMDAMPAYIYDAIAGFWKKLRAVQKDHPVIVYVKNGINGEGWYVIVNGEVSHGPFESEGRAKFFWECKPCQPTS